VKFKEDGECVGVLLPVDDNVLKMFDQREMGYRRFLLSHNNVQRVPFLTDEHYRSRECRSFFETKEENPESLRLWVYVQEKNLYPTPDHPIVQSYIDTILRGCLSISEEFAAEFIASTEGWHPEEFDDDDDSISSGNSVSSGNSISSADSMSADESMSNDDSSVMDDVSLWVDDRHDPIYIRGDMAYSRKKAQELDRLLKTHRPHHFCHRRPVVPRKQ